MEDTTPYAHPFLTGGSDPLTKARLLAALIGGSMAPSETTRWVQKNDGARALDELIAAGSVRWNSGGHLALCRPRRRAALDALARDLQL